MCHEKDIRVPKFTLAVINEVRCQANLIISYLSVSVEMSFLLLLHLLLHLCIVSAKQSRLKEMVKDDLEETVYKSGKLNNDQDKDDELMQRVERMEISWKAEKAHLENKLEAKNVEVENLQEQLKEVKVQFTEIESRMEEVMLSTQKKNENTVEEVASLKSEMRAEVKKEVDKGLRDLPFEMVCAFKHRWEEAESVITFDQITVEVDNSNKPGGGDGTMNIETGVFTTVTSGYYIVTYSANVNVLPGEYTNMWLYHNGVAQEASRSWTDMNVGSDGNFIADQSSRTLVSIMMG